MLLTAEDSKNLASVPLTSPVETQSNSAINKSPNTEVSSNLKKEPIQTSKSWLLLAVFAYYQILASFALNGYYSCAENVAEHFGVASNWITFVQVGCYGLCALKFPAMYVGDRYGMIFTFCVGVGFFTVGMIIRFVDNFYCFAIGTLIAQIGQPFFQCLPASIALLHFRREHRALTTAIGVFADFTGVGFGMFISGLATFAYRPYFLFIVESILAIAGAAAFFCLVPRLPNRKPQGSGMFLCRTLKCLFQIPECSLAFFGIGKLEC